MIPSAQTGSMKDSFKSFQFLEDLSTAYWLSQVFFTALELNLFSHLDQGPITMANLARISDCKEDELYRLLRALKKLSLIDQSEETWLNTEISSRFLVTGKPDFMGEFFLYRKYLRPHWDGLTQTIQKKQKKMRAKELTYEQKNYSYVKAMDTLVYQKSKQIT